MPQSDQAEFYRKQISLTEWLGNMDHPDTAVLRREDFEKYDRLEVLCQTIGLPYGRPRQFPAGAVAARDPEFETYVHDHASDLCMIRIVPHDPGNPKFRMRGKTIAEAIEWFKQQAVDPARYDIYLVPHAEDHSWGTIFVVNQHGVFGETINGEHNKLTQGLYEADEHPATFSSNFVDWHFDPSNAEAAAYIRGLIAKLKVDDPESRDKLTAKLGASFAHDYLCGYFETTCSRTLGTSFLDYSPALGRLYEDFVEHVSPAHGRALVRGQAGSPGTATGRVHIVMPDQVATAHLEPDEILVCRMTTPDYLPVMQQAAAIVTDLGGTLSHAAIVARELHKPCLTATGTATTALKPGQTVTVDADAGLVRKA